MPLKRGNKTYKSFGTLVGALQREGHSKEAATKIAGKIQANQEGNKRRKKN